MTFAFHLLIVLFAGCFLGRYSEAFKNGMINQHMRFRRFFFPPLKGYEYIIQVKAANQRAAASDANLFLDIYGSKGTASKLKLGNLMTFNDFQSGKTDQFKVKLRDLGEIRKITLGHDNFARKPNWYLDRITIKAHDGNHYKFICNCSIMKIKELFPEGKRPPGVPAPGGCGGIFKDASHCWPFDDEIAEESPDLKGSSPAELEDGARIADSVARVHVASTLERGSWINMGNFKGKCISEPNLCRTGVTMIFWANIETSEISANPATSQYVFSSGGSDKRSQGFSFFHKNNSYVLQVVNGRKKWREEIPLSRIPSDCWFSFAFTWSKAQGMRHFINGKPDGQPILQPVDANVQHVNRFHGFRISKPNSNNNIEEMMPMKIDQFVTWGKILSETQILQAFKEGGEVSCNKGNASNSQACNPTPCFNGGTCKIDVDEPRGYRCVCPEGFAGLQCELYEEEPTQGSSTAAPTSSVHTGGSTTAPVSTSATSLTGKPTSPGGGSTAPSTGPTSSSTTERPGLTGGSTVNPTSGESLTTAPTTKGPASTTGEGTKSQTSATSAAPTTAKPTIVGASTKNPTTGVISTSSPTTPGGSTNKPGTEGATSSPPPTSGVTPKNVPTTAPPMSGGPTTAGSKTAKPTTVGASKSAPTTPGASTTKIPTTAPPTTGGLTTAGGSTRKPIAGGQTTKMPPSPGVSTNKSPTTAPPITGGPTTGGGSTGKPTVVGETTKPPTPGISTKTAPTAAPPTAGGATTAGLSTKKPTSGAQTTAIPATLGGSTTKAPTTATPTSQGPTTGSSSKSSESATTATPSTFKPTSAGSNTSSPPTIGTSTATPTATGGSTRKATTVKGSRGKPTSKPTAGGETTAGTTVGGSTGIGGSTRKPTSVSTASPSITGARGGSTPAGAPTIGGGSKKPTTVGTTTAAPTTSPTLPGGSSKIPTSGGASSGGTTTISTPAPAAQPVTLRIKLEIKILIDDLIQEIDNFRRLHQAPDVKLSVTLSQVANQWANKIANEGVERIDPNSNYGQLVCSHNPGGNTAKACVVKWYGAIKFFDWSNPKLTKNASPFTQLVWKNNSAIGVGVARGGGGIKKQNVGGKNFIVVLFEPGQNDAGDIKDNVLAATGISEPDPGAACPKGYSKVPQGSRSCFKVNTTPLTWDDSIYGCALDNGSLASLQSKEEADLVVSLIRASNESEAWIGLHDSSSEGRYVWLDGSAIPFSEWLQGEPNGRTSENCIIQSKGTFLSGWADRPCSEKKAFVCEVPVPGYTNYKLIFLMTEPQNHPYQDSAYSQPFYPGSYSMCLPYIQSGNELLKETIIRYFQTKNMFVQPVINTIRCMNNGSSFLEVTVKLGPGDVSESIESLKASIKENDGVLDLASGAKAKLVSVEILSPGVSYCPNHCTTTSCQPGCDQFCCIQPAAGQYQPQMPYQPPFQQQYQQRYQQPLYQPQQQEYHQRYQPQYQQPYPQSASYNNRGPWLCPPACTRSGSQCPSYCSPRCCKKRLPIKIHRF